MDPNTARAAAMLIRFRDNATRIINENGDLPRLTDYYKGQRDAYNEALAGLAGMLLFHSRLALEAAVAVHLAQLVERVAGLPIEGAVEPMGGWEPRS